jgi:hypothetical protein
LAKTPIAATRIRNFWLVVREPMAKKPFTKLGAGSHDAEAKTAGDKGMLRHHQRVDCSTRSKVRCHEIVKRLFIVRLNLQFAGFT